MKRFVVTMLILGVAGIFASAEMASAGTQDGAKIALTLRPHAAKATARCTTGAPTALACNTPDGTSNLIVEGAVGVNYDTYIVVLDLSTSAGFGGAALGIQYGPSVGIFDWVKCTDLEFPGQGWPASGGGNTLTFAACQGQAADPSDVQLQATVVLGSFYTYAYGPDVMTIVKRAIATPDLKIADCAASESNLELPQGTVGFGGEPGYQPCQEPPVPVEATTWGAIKKGLE